MTDFSLNPNKWTQIVTPGGASMMPAPRKGALHRAQVNAGVAVYARAVAKSGE